MAGVVHDDVDPARLGGDGVDGGVDGVLVGDVEFDGRLPRAPTSPTSPWPDAPPGQAALAWDDARPSPLVESFVAAARSTVADPEGRG